MIIKFSALHFHSNRFIVGLPDDPQAPQNREFPPHHGARELGDRNPQYHHGMPSREGPPGHFMGGRFSEHERAAYMQHPRDHRGAGEPQHLRGHPDLHQHPMGPGGDHHPQRKRTPSPLPLVIPTDPREYEIWQQKMEAKYSKGDTKVTGEGRGHELLSVGRPQDKALEEKIMQDIKALQRNGSYFYRVHYSFDCKSWLILFSCIIL